MTMLYRTLVPRENRDVCREGIPEISGIYGGVTETEGIQRFVYVLRGRLASTIASRKSPGGQMRPRNFVAGIVGVLSLIVVVSMIPDIIRYMKIKSM
jgi:hypothetical protein